MCCNQLECPLSSFPLTSLYVTYVAVISPSLQFSKDRLKAAFLAVCGATRKDGGTPLPTPLLSPSQRVMARTRCILPSFPPPV